MNNDKLRLYYDILDISPGVTLDELNEAYHRALDCFSDDNNHVRDQFSDRELNELSELIQEAYFSLSDYLTTVNYQDSLPEEYTYSLSTGTEADDIFEDDSSIQYEASVEKIAVITKPNLTFEEKTTPPFSRDNPDVSVEEELAHTEAEDQGYDLSLCDGILLKQIREEKCIPLEDISAKTNISVAHLRSIEANSFQTLPAAVFVKSYVKQIATILDLEAQTVADSYIRLYNEAREQAF